MDCPAQVSSSSSTFTTVTGRVLVQPNLRKPNLTQTCSIHPSQISQNLSKNPSKIPPNPLRTPKTPLDCGPTLNPGCFPQIQGVSPPKKPSCARQTQQNQQHQVCCDKARGTCCKQGGLEEKLTQFPISIGTSGKPSFVHLHEVESLAFSSGLG